MLRKELADSILGRLVWNDHLGSLEGKFQLSPDHEIEFTIDFKLKYSHVVDFDDIDFLPHLIKAHRQLTTLLKSEEEIRFAVVDQITQSYCREFHIEGVDHSEIAQNISLYAIDVFSQGGLNLYYSVNRRLDWWKEHDITVVVSEDGEVNEFFWL